jgi:hypothetical protein
LKDGEGGGQVREEDDRLLDFFSEEPLPPHNKVFLLFGEESAQAFSF